MGSAKMTQVTASHSVHCGGYVVPRYVVAPPPAATAALASLRLSFLLRYSADRYLRFLAARTTRSVTLDLTSVTLLGQYDTWSVSRPNLPPFRACEHASSAVLHGSPETLITGNSHACPKCEPTRARPNCLHNPPSIAQRPAPRDALIVNEAQPASRVGQ